MNSFRKLSQDPYLLTVLALIVALSYFRSSVLQLPFYWDEAWVYEPAVRAMHENGPSLFPNSIDSSLSRGHTLLFHSLGAIWMNVFGTEPFILRLFALAISALLVLATYISGAALGSRKVGLGAVLLLITTESFLAQSTFLLPEILLAFFCLLAVIAFVKKKWIAYIAFASAALYTKESAIVLVIAMLCWQVVRVTDEIKTIDTWSTLRQLIITTTPLFIVSIFFISQKLLLGWVFFPVHLDLISFEPVDIIYKFKNMYGILFEHNGGVMLTYAFAFAATILWNGRNYKLSVLICLLYITAIKVIWGRWELPLWPSVIVFLISLGTITYLQYIKHFEREYPLGSFTSLSSIFVVGFLSFSAMNFYSERYLICLLPFIYIGSLLFIERATNTIHPAVFPFLIILFGITRFFYIPENERVNDTHLNYVDGVSVHQQLVAFCEKNALQDSVMKSPFMDSYYLTHEHAGYLSGRSFGKISRDLSSDTRYIIMSYTDDEFEPDRNSTLAGSFILLERFEQGNAWEEIYVKPTP